MILMSLEKKDATEQSILSLTSSKLWSQTVPAGGQIQPVGWLHLSYLCLCRDCVVGWEGMGSSCLHSGGSPAVPRVSTVLKCSQTLSSGRCCVHMARKGSLQMGIWAPGTQNKAWTTLWIKSFFLARKRLRKVNILHSPSFKSPN